MSGRSRFILELKEKIEICCELFYVAEKLQKPTKKELAECAGIKFDTLKYAYESGRISPGVERRLATFCLFETSDPAWLDDTTPEKDKRRISDKFEYTGRDTAEHFRQRLSSILGLKNDDILKIGNKITDKNAHNLALINLANIKDTPSDEFMELFLQIDLSKGYIGAEYSFGFSEVRVYIIKEPGCGSYFVDPLASLDGKLINGLFVKARGTLEDPYWIISSEDELIEGRYWLSEPLIKLKNPTEGDCLEIELRAHLFDGSFCVLSHNQSTNQEQFAVISALIANKFGLQDKSDGNIILARQKISVVKSSNR